MALAAPADAGGFVSSWVDVAGLATHCRVSTAARAGVPVVLVHGLAVSHRYLMPTAVALAARHPVYVPDLPGFGLTGKPRRAYSVAEHARHLDGWLAALGLTGVCALGHSFGAEVVAALAAAYPNRVSALVLGGPTSDPAARSRRAQVARFVWNLAGEDPRQARILARDVRDAGPRRVWATVGHSVRNAIERDVAAAGVPTLVFGGARDRVSPLPWRRRLAAEVAGGAQVSVPGAAHNAATTAGPQVADAVTGFLDLTVCPGRL
ncbi:MAG TPA: alpha/beta fold hydrolase [Pilimelia sp.]|nr:alpha/beta fold hydrolase [Pilimelia sp.]